ncbi:MAG: hypothetical protein U0Z44_16155 [Kouleothrix sp.]
MPIEKPTAHPSSAAGGTAGAAGNRAIPFEWLGAHWGQLGALIVLRLPNRGVACPRAREPVWAADLLALACYPALRDRPARYAALLLAGAGKELLQLAFKQRPVN